MLELRHFRALREAQRTQSISAAARALHITPSAVSRSISELERNLGVSLVRRSGGKIHITKEGTQYLKLIGEALDTLELAGNSLAGDFHAAKGNVKLSVPSMFARVALLPKLNGFLQANPEIDLQLMICDVPPDPVSQKLDLWLQYGKPSTMHHVIKVVSDPPVRLVASPEYLAESPPLEVPQDLQHHTCLFQHKPERRQWRLYRTTGKSNSRNEVLDFGHTRMKIIDHSDLLYQAACEGLGIMAADIGMIANELKSRMLQIVLPDYTVRGDTKWMNHLCLLYNKDWGMPQRVEIVKDFLVRCGRELTERQDRVAKQFLSD